MALPGGAHERIVRREQLPLRGRAATQLPETVADVRPRLQYHAVLVAQAAAPDGQRLGEERQRLAAPAALVVQQRER